MKITFSGTYDECLEQARRFVEAPKVTDEIIPQLSPAVKTNKTEQDILDELFRHPGKSQQITPNFSVPICEVKGKVYKLGRVVDIHVGSKESGFVFYKRYCSVLAAADSIGASAPTVCRCLKEGTIYKGIYKFFYSS